MNNIPHKPVAQEKKSKRKFNFIDFLVVLVIISVIGIAFYIFSPWSKIEKLWSNNQVEITYLVEMKDVSPEDIELIKAGDSVKNSVTKNLRYYITFRCFCQCFENQDGYILFLNLSGVVPVYS